MRLMVFMLLMMPLAAYADQGTVVDPLPCGIYDEAVNPVIEKDLLTQSTDTRRYTMAITTKSGKQLSVTVQNVAIRMAGERNHVSIFLDGKPYAKTSHQDVPLYVEVTIDDMKYRIICVRTKPIEDRGAAAGSSRDGILPREDGNGRTQNRTPADQTR